MDSADPAAFPSELGDLLLQVVFHSVLAEEAGRFSVSDVIESVYTKMVRRHPHVFGDARARTSADVLRNWEQIKAAERADAHGKNAGSQTRELKSAGASKQISPLKAASGASESLLSDDSRSLPAVLEACQLTRSASRVGFDWDSLSGVLDKLAEESQELVAARNEAKLSAALDPRVEEEAGDLLFAAVNVARFLGVDPEIALKRANRKFRSRFRFMERSAAAQGRRFADVPRPQMEELWNASKKPGAGKSPEFSE
jgi:MazG family protein